MGLSGFDTVILANLLAHVEESTALASIWPALNSGGRALIVVPLNERLYCTLDQALGRKRRYDRKVIEGRLAQDGFRIVKAFDFNRLYVPLWLLNGKLLRRKLLSRIELKILDTLIPLSKRIDKLWPWSGLALVIVAEKE